MSSNSAEERERLAVRPEGAARDWLLGAVREHGKAIAAGERVLKNEHKTAITRIEHEGRAAVVKHYRYMGARLLLKGLFRRHPARRSIDAAIAMGDRGVPTPRPLGLIERRVAGLTAEAWFVAEAIERSVEMDRYVLRNFREGSGRARRARFARAFAEALTALMRSGIHHRDLKTCNILVTEVGNTSAGEWGFAFIDLDDVAIRAPDFQLTRDDWLLALAQLNPSTPKDFPWTDRLRFLDRLVGDFEVLRTWPRRDLIARVQEVSRRRRRAYFSDKGPVDIEFV